jgi:hypothetical protein
MVGPTGALARIGKLPFNRRHNLCFQMIHKLPRRVQSDLANRTARHDVLAIAVGYGLHVIVEAMLVEFAADDSAFKILAM